MDSFSLSHVEKKGSISMNHVFKRVQFCEYEKKVQFWESCSKRVNHFWVILLKKSQFLDPNWKKVPSPESQKSFLSWSQIIFKKVQFFESFCEEGSILCLQVKSVQFFEQILKIRFNSLSHNPKKEFNSVSRVQKECSILWIRTESVQLSLRKMGSILCVMKKKKVQFF